MVALPRALAGQPEYERSVVVSCPSNNSSDRQREVTYRLQRRYVSFTTTVHPYFASADDRDSNVYAYALTSVREIDDTITRTVKGTQFEARMGTPRELTADVDGADQLTVRVRCEFPGGFVVLTGATLTPA